MAAIIRDYKYQMGFKVDSVKIPDPSVFTGADSALDSKGGRDATGKLHRNMVARKHPLKIEYHNIPFAMMSEIMSLMQGQSFKFTFPDPMMGVITIKAYAGDLEWTVAQAPEKATTSHSRSQGGGGSASNASGGGGSVLPDGSVVEEQDTWKNSWFGDLKFSVIEY